MESVEQRQARKVFQNYFTTLLYEKPSILLSESGNVKSYNIADYINKELKESSKRIWSKVIDHFYDVYKDDNNTIQDVVKKGWEEYCRLYLKGGKSTLEFIKSALDSYKSGSNKGNIAKALYHDLKYNTDDSDYDFCFVLNPALLTDSNYIRINRKLQKIIKEEKFLINISPIIPDLLERINSPFNQKKILKKLVLESYHYFTPEEQNLFDEFLRQCDNINESYFNFTQKDTLIDFIEKKVKLTTDTFFLHRLVIPFKFVDEKFNFPTVKDKLYAECIDISFSSIKEVTEKLWNKTDLNNILRPLLYLDKEHTFNYPIVGLHYQLSDIVIILSEQNPNKPQKRCKRLIEQLYFSCMEEKLPELPSIINIGKSVYELMQQEGECEALNKILTFEKSITIKEEEVYVFKLNDSIRDIEKFELWCKNSYYNNISLSWESQCNIDFISKQELIRRIINICKEDFNVTIKDYFYDNSKRHLCILYKHLLLITVISSLLEGHISSLSSLDNEWVLKDIKSVIPSNINVPLKEPLQRIIQLYVNKHPLDLYETLIGYIKSFFTGTNKDIFIETLDKFTLK